MKHLETVFTINPIISKAILCDDMKGGDIIYQQLSKKFDRQAIQFIKSDIALDYTDTIEKNLEFYQITKNQREQLQYLLKCFTLTDKINKDNFLQQIVLQLCCGINRQFCFLDFPFDKLTDNQQGQCLSVLKKIQHFFDIQYIFIFDNTTMGRYFDELYVYQSDTNVFIPLKVIDEGEVINNATI